MWLQAMYKYFYFTRIMKLSTFDKIGVKEKEKKTFQLT